MLWQDVLMQRIREQEQDDVYNCRLVGLGGDLLSGVAVSSPNNEEASVEDSDMGSAGLLPPLPCWPLLTTR